MRESADIVGPFEASETRAGGHAPRASCLRNAASGSWPALPVAVCQVLNACWLKSRVS